MKWSIGLFVCLLASTALAGPAALPTWFPASVVSINPDSFTVEDFGTQDFKVGANKDNYDTVEAKGHHWSGSVYPPGAPDTWDKWNGLAAWKTIRPQLEKQGFKIVYQKPESDNIDVTMRKGSGADATYVELFLGNDPYSNSIAVIEPSAHARTVVLEPPAAKPETFTAKQDFPYLTPLAGAKLLDTQPDDNGPLDVTAATDKEPHLVGTGTLTKQYEGPANVSPIDFSTTYEAALTKAGWTVVDKRAGSITAHYAKNGREVWARLAQEGSDRWDITVADVGSIAAALAKSCTIAVYGINFDFDKATLRADSEPVLQQVAAAMKAKPSQGFEIGGHTDNVGKSDYNAKLSQDRADSVKAWLVAHGVGAKQLTTKGYGDSKPVVPNTTDAGRARNRRVELHKAGC